MSRAFVKEDDLAQPLPERPISEYPNYVTASGLAQLQQRLAEANARLTALQAQPDTAERALELEPLAREQRYLSARLASAIPVTPPDDPQRVSFGCRVEIEDDDGRRTVRIVGEDEADASGGRIGWTAPLARALQGAAVGDVVIWERPAGAREVEVLALSA